MNMLISNTYHADSNSTLAQDGADVQSVSLMAEMQKAQTMLPKDAPSIAATGNSRYEPGVTEAYDWLMNYGDVTSPSLYTDLLKQTKSVMEDGKPYYTSLGKIQVFTLDLMSMVETKFAGSETEKAVYVDALKKVFSQQWGMEMLQQPLMDNMINPSTKNFSKFEW